MTSSEVTTPLGSASLDVAANGRKRSPQEIEAEINTARDNLASTLDQLAVRTNPKNVAMRGVAKVRGVFQEEDGSIKPKPVAIAAGVLVLLVVYRIRKSRIS